MKATYKVFALCAAIVICSMAMLNTSKAETVYGHGYQAGVITKFSIMGAFRKWGFGRMLMGKDSTERAGAGNPWVFEMEPSFEAEALNHVESGAPVVVEYTTYQFLNWMINVSKTRAEKFHEVLASDAPTESCSNPGALGDYSHGTVVGRIVSARRGGLFMGTKSFEITIQEGDGGNEFKQMSITSEPVYKCAVQWLFSGVRTSISYRQNFVTLMRFDQKTNYDVWQIKPIKQN